MSITIFYYLLFRIYFYYQICSVFDYSKREQLSVLYIHVEDEGICRVW